MTEKTIHDFGKDFGTLTKQEIESLEEHIDDLMNPVKEATEVLSSKS